MISAAPCPLPWSTKRLQYLSISNPTLSLACIDAQQLKTVDVSILKIFFAAADLLTNLSLPSNCLDRCLSSSTCGSKPVQSICSDMVPNISNALTNDAKSIEFLQFKLAYEKTEKSQFLSNSFILLTGSDKYLNQFERLSLQTKGCLEKKEYHCSSTSRNATPNSVQ